jgi:hypothetical protein
MVTPGWRERTISPAIRFASISVTESLESIM